MTPPPLRFTLPRLVAHLCRLRGDPQDFPYSPKILALLIGAGVALDMLAGSAFDDGNAFARSLLSGGIVLALCWVALAIRGVRNRYVQTVGALFACSLLISLVQMPIAFLLGSYATGEVLTAAQLVQDLFQSLLRMAAFATLVWQILVNAHVMRCAMDAAFGFALALVTAWAIAFWSIDYLLFGAT